MVIYMDYSYKQLLSLLALNEETIAFAKGRLEVEDRKQFLQKEIDAIGKEKIQKDTAKKNLEKWDNPDKLAQLNQSIMELASRRVQLKKEYNELGAPVDDDERIRLGRVLQHAEKERVTILESLRRHPRHIQEKYNNLCEKFAAIVNMISENASAETYAMASFELRVLAKEFKEMPQYKVAITMAENCDKLQDEYSEKSRKAKSEKDIL